MASKLGLEDQEDSYGTKVAVKLYNRPFSEATRESTIVRKIAKQKFFASYKGYIQTPDRRLGKATSAPSSPPLVSTNTNSQAW